jgi:glycine oxidase
MSQRQSSEVLVVGGGIIGLAIAWRARQAGMSVTVLERDALGGATSRVAAGMLAPVAEVEFGAGGRRLLELGVRSAAMWPAFAAELERRTGASVGLMSTGTLLLARDEDDARELERQLELRRSLGLDVTRLRPSQARECEPALAPSIRMALEAPDDHSVDPRPVLAALASVCAADGVQVRTGVTVARVELGTPSAAPAGSGGGRVTGGERVTGVTLANGERVEAEQVVLAAGPWSGQIDGLPEGAGVPVRPVKGQILRLRDPAGPGLLSRVLRFRGGYLVPREDGGYVLGATVEERGYELAPTAGGVYEMLRDAHELVPGISELCIEELSVGLRPGTPDNAPAIGPGAVPGLVWATGHYRNGILLAPLTAELIVGVLAGDGRAAGGGRAASDGRVAGDGRAATTADANESLLAACAPGRFTASAHAREVEGVIA